MSRYLLTEEGARKIHQALSPSGSVGSRVDLPPSVTFDRVFDCPWTLRYSSSVVTGEIDGEYTHGGWIIWLPEGSWSGAHVDDDEQGEHYMRPLTPEDDDMPEGWYLLPEELSDYLSEDSGSVTNDLYVERIGDFICLTDEPTDILVARVFSDTGDDVKDVMQILRSAIIEHPDRGCFRIRRSSGVVPAGFDNPYYMVGSRLYAATNLTNFGALSANKIVALVVDISGSQPVASISQVASFAELQALADYERNAIFPLYETDEKGGVKADLRNVPTMAAKEFVI